MAAAADLAAHAPPARMPKLKYRKPWPAGPVPQSAQSPLPSAQSHAAVQNRPPTPDSKSTSASSRLSSETASLTSLSLASTTSSATTSSNDSRSSKAKKKRKPSSVLGFLSLKEPSQLALEQFAEQQRKQSATKGSSTPASSTFVGKQLPPNVPKVNSKWDGIPVATKKHHSVPAVSSSKANSSSLSSQGSLSTQLKVAPWNDSRMSVFSDGTRNPPNSIASASTSMASLSVSSAGPAYGSSPSTTTLPEMSYYFPNDPVASGALPVAPVDAHQTNSPSEKFAGPPPRLPESSVDLSSRSGESDDHRSDSPASSTDSVDTIVKENAEAIYKKLNNRPQQSFWGAEAPPIQPVDEIKSGLVPDSHDFLFGPPPAEAIARATPVRLSEPVSYYAPPRPAKNFSRPIAPNRYTPPLPRPATYRSAPSISALPTLYETSLASTESLVTVRNDNDSGSIAPSTIAPSELSGHWYESPRERLGLGGRLRMNDVLPWESSGEPPGKPKKTRLSMFGLSIAKS